MPERFDEGLVKAMGRRVNYPNGAWPTEMRAETAAGYCDEPSVEAFLSKVKLGLYPKPCKRKVRCQSGTAPSLMRRLRYDMGSRPSEA